MKKILIILSFLPVLLAGCQESAQKGKSSGMIVVKPTGRFPRFLAGTWKADRFNWQITFGKNGNISSIVHVIWAERIDLEQGQGYYYMDGPDEGAYAYFIIGDCEGSYDSAERNLKMKIIMDDYEIRLPAGSLKGRSEDYFDGKISEDGTKWYADWRGYGYLEDAAPPDVNRINANPVKLVFSKIDDK